MFRARANIHANLSLSTQAFRLPLRISTPTLHRQRTIPASIAYSVHANDFQADHIPFRKQLKDEARKRRTAQRLERTNEGINDYAQDANQSKLERWRLTVGLEIHAQLNTEKKLFSTARTSNDDTPNSNISFFDLAIPGSQPEFQKETLIPALRAALGLSCQIERISQFDRKHYYYQDQPAGYQITQYYKPFATKGHITVYDHDGIASEDGRSIEVGIQQVQMEQDTAKSTLQPPTTALLDFNRVGHPLIEIITLPQIHHPQTAAACVKKIQAILQTVNAVTTGMELGGLRADVNVSVSPKGSDVLGQRTEIKNLSSFKAVEDAIIAERDRQISVLESGGKVDGETRGWTLGSTETKKLRGKEGEVDYRYMPDPDIPPLVIGTDLVAHIFQDLPKLSDEIISDLIDNFKLTSKDAKTLVALDDGQRLDYFDDVCSLYHEEAHQVAVSSQQYGRLIANWALHELGGLLNSANISFSENLVPAKCMSKILFNLEKGLITGTTAKRLLAMTFDGDKRPIDSIIEEDGMVLMSISRDGYILMAQTLIDEHQDKVKQIQQKQQLGKLQFFVGQMMRQGKGKIEAAKAEAILKQLLGLL